MNLLQISEMNEEKSRDFLEKIMWPDGTICPHCNGTEKIYSISDKTARSGLYECGNCHKQFTVTVGTVMQGSHLTMKQWVLAFYLMCSSKKGVSALQLQRNLGLKSYKTAWYLAHRIRYAMQEEPLKGMLKGTVEVDETYIGGKSREGKRGRGSERKTPVMVLVERDGKSMSKPVENVSGKTLKSAIKELVNKNSTIMTDDWPSYFGIGKNFKGGHKVIKHSEKQYVNGDVSTNTAESFFALLKRGIHGTFHHTSKGHLKRYCDEFSFRWNNRGITDGERTISAIKRIKGKRLLYRSILFQKA